MEPRRTGKEAAWKKALPVVLVLLGAWLLYPKRSITGGFGGQTADRCYGIEYWRGMEKRSLVTRETGNDRGITLFGMELWREDFDCSGNLPFGKDRLCARTMADDAEEHYCMGVPGAPRY
jgi:hypothetical protein